MVEETIMADEVSRLWIYKMPGLTPKILYEAMVENGALVNSQLTNLGPEQWLELKQTCEKKLGLTKDWEKKGYEKAIESLIPEWRKENQRILSQPMRKNKKGKR